MDQILIQPTNQKKRDARAKVVEALAVIAKYNPFFEKAEMLRVDYVRDGASVENRVRELLEARGFDFTLAKSKLYCNQFFNVLNDRDRKALTMWLTEFTHQPFIKIERCRLTC